jgi:hypothetical protein
VAVPAPDAATKLRRAFALILRAAERAKPHSEESLQPRDALPLLDAERAPKPLAPTKPSLKGSSRP